MALSVRINNTVALQVGLPKPCIHVAGKIQREITVRGIYRRCKP